MPVAVADGILGKEAVHTWTPWSGPALALNNLELTPRYMFEQITGLHDLPDADDFRSPRFGTIGELTHPSGVRGKTVVYEGIIQARNSQEMRSMANAMRAAFRERNREGTMTAVPHPSYGTEYFSYTARVTSLKIDDNEVVTNVGHPRDVYQKGFMLTLRQSDPRYYMPAHAVAVNGPNLVNVTNIGTAHVDPVIHVAGATGVVGIGRSGGPLLVLELPGGPYQLEFDFWKRSITTDAGVDMSAYLSVINSTWWDALVEGIPPGAHAVSLVGGSEILVQFTPASW